MLAMRSLILAISLVALAVPASARAPQGGKQDLKTYCSSDAATFCSDKDPGTSEMDACFKKNMSKLSEGCRRAITAYKHGRR